MIAKTFEVRGLGTFIPVLAVKLDPGCESDRYLLSRSGFGRTRIEQRNYVTMSKLDGGHGRMETDPYSWDTYVMIESHDYIRKNFDELESGDVIDVDFISGRSPVRKESERLLS